MTPARRTRVRVTKSPAGDWFWICRIPGPAGRVDLWCTQQSFSSSANTHAEALRTASEHWTRHDADGNLTLTVDDFLLATSRVCEATP